MAMPTSLILVRKDVSGRVVLRYVRGEAAHSEGTYVWIDQPVALPQQSGLDQNQKSVPTAVYFPKTDRIYVARAIVASQQTSIFVVDSGYATMLAESQARIVITRPRLIDSAVSLAFSNEQLLLVWREGNYLKGVKSHDGMTWSQPETLFTFAGGGPFALWSDNNAVYLAYSVYTFRQGWKIKLAVSANGATFTPLSLEKGVEVVKGISTAVEKEYVFVAYCSSKSVKVLRCRKDGSNLSIRTVYQAPPDDPNYQIHAVTIHPSPYGWALQYVASFQAQEGIQYVTFGLRSRDGLNYRGTTWIYSISERCLGPTAMTTTPVPMPWIVKTHDSGKSADEVYNFVITGDGFTYAERDKFLEAAKLMTANIVNRAPFFYNQDLFNVWAVSTFSKDSGFDSSPTVDDKDTIFGAYQQNAITFSTKQNGIIHARRVVTGNPNKPHFYGFMFFNVPEDQRVYICPCENVGVPMPYYRNNSQVPIHEYCHTRDFGGGFSLGDHDYHNQIALNANKSFDSNLTPTGQHAWQHWFVFVGPAASRLIQLTDAYRQGLINWIANGNSGATYWIENFPYSDDPNSPHYVDALSLFNVGLWESELSDVPDLRLNQQYTALRACAMNSLTRHVQIFCPVCSEIIVKHLQTVAGIVNESAGRPFDAIAFQGAPGAFLEFQFKNYILTPNGPQSPPALNLENLVIVNGHTVPVGNIFTYESDDYTLHLIGRVDLNQWVTPGVPATVVFRNPSPPSQETRIWIPSIQILNSKGARYPMQPMGEALIARLHQKHAPQYDYEFWDLSEGDLTITFTPNTIP